MQSGLYLLICNSEIKTTRHAHVCVSVCLDVRIHVPPSSLKCTAAQFQLAWSYDRPLQKSGGLEPNSIAIHANGILPPTLVLVLKKDSSNNKSSYSSSGIVAFRSADSLRNPSD